MFGGRMEAANIYSSDATNNTIPLNTYYTIQEGSVIPTAPTTIRPSWVAAHDTSLAYTDTLSWNAAPTGTGTTTYQVQIASNLCVSTIVKTLSGIDGNQHNNQTWTFLEVLLARAGVRQ